MKGLNLPVMVVALLALAFSSPGATNLLEQFSPHFSPATPILWNVAPANLPKSFWIYKKILPHVFPQEVVSNATVLASYQGRGIPRPSTNDTCIVDDPDCKCECAIHCNFSINPESAEIEFGAPDQSRFTNQIPGGETVVNLARKYAPELGVELSKVVEKNLTARFKIDSNGNDLTNQLCGRGVNLSRQLDGFSFWGTGDNGPNIGFWIEFGSFGKIRAFSVNWPELQRCKSEPTASLPQIAACIRAHRVLVIPDPEETTYFERLKSLDKATRFTITKITPYYGDGAFGETPANNEASVMATPFAELEAMVDLGNRQATVRFLAPILSSDVLRLLQR